MRLWIALSFILFNVTSFSSVHWKTLQPGLYYAAPLFSKFIAFKIDPEKFNFRIVVGNPTAYVSEFGSDYKALIAINGGYFSESLHPLGLRISNDQLLSKVKPISWWGIFYMRHHQPKITTAKMFSRLKDVSFAIQAGPRLIVNNNIMPLKTGTAVRSAIGISQDNHIIIASSKSEAITLTQWAHILQKETDCKAALNLDGGSSAQLYVNLPSLKIDIKNFNPVTDAIIVTEK